MKARTARHACLHSPITVRPPASPFAHMLPGPLSPEVSGSVKGDRRFKTGSLRGGEQAQSAFCVRLDEKRTGLTPGS